MKKLAVILLCFISSGCTDEQVEKVQRTKWSDDPNTTISDMLDHRPICKDVMWSSASDEGRVVVSYICDLTNYENHLLRIMNRDIIRHEKADSQKIRKYKEDIEVSDFRLDQLSRLEKALEELDENGIAELYKSATEKLNMNKLDYSYIFKGPIEPIIPVEGYDDEAQKSVYTSLKIIQETLLRHGIVRESYAHIGLNRAKTKNVDYLKVSHEDKEKWISYDRDLITQRKTSAMKALKELEGELPKQVELYNTLGNTQLVTSIKQEVVWEIVSGEPIPIMCGFDYVTFNGKTISLNDSLKSCMHMVYSQSYDTDYQELFTEIYQRILKSQETEQL